MRKFRYVLESLLRKSQWDVDVARAEAARAQQVLEQKRQHLREVERTVAGIEDEIRELQAGGGLSLDKYHSLQAFLRHQRERQEAAAREVEQADLVYEQIMTQLTTLKRTLNGLDKHKAGKQKAHQVELERLSLKESDESWLLRKRQGR